MDLKNKKVIYSGGFGGIGLACVREFLKSGVKVNFNDTILVKTRFPNGSYIKKQKIQIEKKFKYKLRLTSISPYVIITDSFIRRHVYIIYK